jgi:hypothetical protein
MPSTLSGNGSLSGVGTVSAPDTVYALGDTGPAGGIIFYDAGSTLSWGRYMEAAVSTTSPTWVDNTNLLFANNYNANVSTSTAIGTGKTNSNAWYANNTTVYQGINAARNYTGGAKTDWFIPSKDELNQIYIQKTTVGGTPASGYAKYASSSQDGSSSFYFWNQNMLTGVQAAQGKYDYYYFRPIRYV